MFRIYLLLLMLATPLQADIQGAIRVIDGDTIDVGDTRIRLFGIDAPENGQPCIADGRAMDCGGWVTDQITAIFDRQQAVCSAIETDRYGRVVATCQSRGVDVGQWIVGEGLALAYQQYSERYLVDEKAAAVAGRGIWSFDIENPAAYRAERTAAPAPPETCAIKGNITKSGHIYHMPHNRDYGRTRINEGKGERWFCSETEARQAGWRAARN